MTNIVSNACDAISNSNEPWIKIEIKENEESVNISITDSGPGIPREIQNKMKESFYTSKPNGVGTGLGLSISKKIIANHDGKLYIDSMAENTCFIISLPKKANRNIKNAC